MADLECNVTVVKELFYKNDFGIIRCNVDKVLSGELKTDRDATVFKGKMPRIREGEGYKIAADYIEDKKFGPQYNIRFLTSAITLDDKNENSKRKYLESIFTKNQVEQMYKDISDPYSALRDGNATELVKISGCGMYRASEWINRFQKEYRRALIYAELHDYNLSSAIIDKLLSTYNSADMVIQKVKEDPYVLITEVRGIGWATADNIAVAGGMSLDDPKRVKAYMYQYLDDRGAEGFSWITEDEFLGAILEQFGEDIPDERIIEAVQLLDPFLWRDKEEKRIGLKYFFNYENKIATELLRIRDAESHFEYKDWEKAVERIESLQGWKYTEEQKKGIELAINNNIIIIQGGAGCVDCDTEFFNGTEWKKISDYSIGEKVLQYNMDGTAELVIPNAYIKNPKEYLWHFSTKYGIDQCLSEDHNCILLSPKGRIKEEVFSSVMERQNKRSFSDRFITAFSYEGEGIDLSDELIRIYIACFADGNFSQKLKPTAKTYTRARFDLTKPRKIARLIELARNAGLKFYVEHYNKTDNPNSYDCFIYMPERIKEFPDSWYRCNKHQLEVIAEEVMFWDGCVDRNNDYSTTIKKNADFIQFVFTALGKRTSIKTSDRRGRIKKYKGKEYVTKSIEYTVHVTPRGYAGITCENRIGRESTEFEKYKTKDGYEYCFNVPSHALVLRRNNNIFITGNCGKTSMVSAILECSKGHSFVQCAFSGKAASRLMEVTAQEGFTIHRLLGFPTGPEEKQRFAFNDENPLGYDIYIIDEISMVDMKLFYYLLRAIPSGSKVICLGDNGQLEAIGAGNIAFDLLATPEIESCTLTKIHRQAEESAIVTESVKIRNKQQIIPEDWVGHEVRGKLQDLDLTCYSDNANTYYEIMKAFNIEWNKSDKSPRAIMNIQVLSPMKNRGASTYQLNNVIQEICNGKSARQEFIPSQYGGYYLKVGDKVINTVNNYKTNPNIFNGNIGILKKFEQREDDEGRTNEYMVIDFDGIGEVRVLDEYWKNIELAYALTVHKFQGSQAETVIFGFDFSAFSLLTKELVYTGITRAMKKCYLIAQNKALRYATTHSEVKNKQTHLQRCLHDQAHPKIIF